MFRSLSLFLMVALVAAKSVKTKKKPSVETVLKSRDHKFQPLSQGDCMEGWIDSSSVDLGCILADMDDSNVDEPTADNVCHGFADGGRLVEIYNMDQIMFLQDLLTVVEINGGFSGYVYWWIGLNDNAQEGSFVWPSGAPADFTWWDSDYGEPYPGSEINCVEMQSAEFFSLKWMTFYCDDTDTLFPVCQIP